MQVGPPLEQTLIKHTPSVRTICVQYLGILLSSFGEKYVQRFALNLLRSNYLWLLFGR